jgi:hypothetical protein
MSSFFVIRTTPWLLLAAAFATSSQAQVMPQGANTGMTIAPQQVINEATSTVQSARQDTGMDALIQRSKAVFIVPRFGESAAAVAKEAANASPSAGTSQSAAALTKYGSPGVLLAHGRNWSSPAFFSVAGVSNSTANQDTNGRGTPVMALFMTDSAAHKMETNGTFSLSDLKVVPYSAQPTTPLENADIVVWSPTHVTTSIGVESSRIHFDSTGSNAFYMNQATLGEILTDNVTSGRAQGLQNALASRVASK